MFTAKPQKNRTAATEYFDEHLSQNDYYSQGQTQAGYWVGEGAERLGLMPGEVVGREAFLRLCDNQHPETGQKLTQVHFADRRVFFDFTCSAPKSVSILAVTMNDSRIVEAHREAAGVAIRELEAFAGTRVRMSHAMEDRTTGNLVAAAFLHTSSRALDPQLHTHFTVFNATFDPVENRWKALQSSGMFGAIHYGTAVYRNELASRLHGLGYGTRSTAHGFEIEGVEQKLIERFSKRSQQRNAAVAREEKRLGRKLSNDEISHVVHQSRPRKVKDATEDEVRARQLDEIGFFEKRALRAVVGQANGERKDFQETVHLGQATGYAVEHVFARKSVAPEHELFEAALVKGCGQVDLPTLKAAVRSDRELVRVGREVSTRKILGEELRLIRFVNDGLGTVAPLAPRFEEWQRHLAVDQRAALGHVLSSSDRVTGFRGLAGTGKTTTLREFGRVVAQAGGEAVFLAPTAGAVDVLRKDGFKEAATLAKLLADPQAQAGIPGRAVLVLDEAGAVGTSDMLRLLEIAQARGARVVLSGDTGQHASVAQGDALRLIEEHSGYRFAVLGEIRRQKPAVFRQAVKLAAGQDAAGAFRLLQKDGAVVEVLADDGPLHEQAAAAYLKAVDAGKSALLVSPTWGEIEAVTGCVRGQLKARGTVAARDETFSVFDSLGWTDAQKRLPERYEPGLQLRFAKKAGQFRPGEFVTVEAVRGRTLVLRSQDGGTAVLRPSRVPAAFDVGEARQLPVATGDWLLLQANGHGFTNGERVQVKAVGKGGIALADGRTLPASYRSFTHGYAVTSHAAQGKTVDVALFVASSRSFAAVSRESFYVGISRGREAVRIFTDDAATLERRVEETHTRKAALELQGLREEMARHGLLRLREEEEKRLKERQRAAAVEDETQRPERDMRAARTLRPVRALRVLRGERLVAPVLTLQRWAQEFRRWIGARAAAQVEAPALSWSQRFHLNQKQQETPRQSRGIRI
jgi:conjugative relaxase-like TrwC/TraI family protein